MLNKSNIPDAVIIEEIPHKVKPNQAVLIPLVEAEVLEQKGDVFINDIFHFSNNYYYVQ